MLKSGPCDYSDIYILVKGTETDTAARRKNKRMKQVTFKHCVIFTHCIS